MLIMIPGISLSIKPQQYLQDEMDAVVAYGLEQHRINFPRLYKCISTHLLHQIQLCTC